MRKIVLTFLFALSAGAAAAQPVADDLAILQPWARATAPNAQTGAIYLGVTNKGARADRLVDVSSDAAAMAHIHQSSMDSGVMKMDRMGDGIALPPGQTVTLKPGGMHIMLMGLKHPLEVGDSVKLVLTFEKAGKIPVEAKVESAGASGPPH